MNPRRRLFLACARAARSLAGSSEVEARWHAPSALERWEVAGLVGHLARATTSVADYLDRNEDVDGEAISAARYYELILDRDLDSELNVAVRARGDEMAAGGRGPLLSTWDGTLRRLEDRLEYETATRRVQVYDDLVLRLDDYLVTRILETIVHSDDVSISTGAALPDFPEEAYELVIDTLVDAARLNRGDLAVVRALARRERDEVEALRVL